MNRVALKAVFTTTALIAGLAFAATSSRAGTLVAAHVSPSAAPEPAAWALMILGFSAAGAALRQRRRILIRHG